MSDPQFTGTGASTPMPAVVCTACGALVHVQFVEVHRTFHAKTEDS